ncbi:amidohydrolase family protein [Gordonia jinhuaensis]|uniref:2-pyrone-4,6-dicarboxylate hydrolase n=1 Tax=Gordonia jinhuaensis TaxID=1517702 RepID=A0A916TER8_9ACTN|nr:amidohydrolase family protein [Gordonia jinhuaensis]GGB39852.1 2-pyrone-4,6-dicarboxylate hydrolase [Gordonia jinhuaensis]
MTSAAPEIFDAHFHIIDRRFPLRENNGYLPDEFTADDYLARVADLGITGGAVVSGSFQGFDQTYLSDALTTLGPGYVGVTQLPASASEEEIRRLDALGVRGLRFNIFRGGSESVDNLADFARRVHDVAGWHVELYADAADLVDLVPVLVALPQISIDHLGMSTEGIPTLLRLVEAGAYVKATGFGRVSVDVPTVVRQIAEVNPEALVFGTDLPSTRAKTPFADSDIARLTTALGEENARKALSENGRRLYRL